MCIIRGCDQNRYGITVANMSNEYYMGRIEYPKDLNSAQSMLVNYNSPVLPSRNRNNNKNNQGAQAQASGQAPEESALTFAKRGTSGSLAGISIDLPVAPTTTMTSVHTGTTLVQYTVMMAEAQAAAIDPARVLLDSQSTMSAFRNKDTLSNIRQSPHVLRVIINGGYQDSNMIGDFANMMGPVWHNESSIANILSLAEVRKICTVTMDRSIDEYAVTKRTA